MILLGLLLLLATGAFIGLLIAYNTSGGPEYTVTMFDNHLATMNSLSIFLSGVALALLFCIGCALAVGAARRRRRYTTVREPRTGAVRTSAERGDALGESATPADEAPPAGPARGPSPRHKYRHHLGH
ncbi:hypothetical protein FBY35_4438 [Streptomyces sp. SLBN-118]|uniref:hypothetical protein n=1 Tax=Streptomyces sp. SLBN-118 TaxID=2768454 RepID=UPI0011682422|nr:hypothetical protein [Streptomyces sp. SLBN-118]TQK42991.1 hypothetical protein FBY35_4438 [Streptomyces sp. SLBN-118]